MKKTPLKTDYLAPFIAQHSYHVYNRTNNKELLFINDSDRLLFLRKYKQFMLPFIKTFSYNLLGNHFHLVIQVKRELEITSFIESIPKKERKATQEKYLNLTSDFRNINELISKQFSNFFTAYATIFNEKHKRQGNLFHRPFSRVFVDDDSHFCNLIYYVHHNAQMHKVHPDFTQYPWSSYNSLLSDLPTLLEREAVLNFYGGKKRYIDFHQHRSDFSTIDHLVIEKD